MATVQNFSTTSKTQVATHIAWHSDFHAPIPGPTRLADSNRFPGRETQDWDSLPEFFLFFLTELVPVGMAHIYNIIKISYQKNYHRSGVHQIYTHLSSPIYLYKTVLLHLQIRARNLHVVNPYKCVGPAVCGYLLTSSPVPTRIKNPC